MEHLDGGPRRVVERDDLFDTPRVGLGQRQLLERHPRRRSIATFTTRQCGVVADLPADGDDPVDVSWHHDDARRALIHPQVQGVLVRTGALGETQYVEGELAPPLRGRRSEP